MTTFSNWTFSIAGEFGATGVTGPTGVGYSSVTSTTSLAIGTGSKVFTITAGSAFATGQRVRAANTVTPANYMEGVVTVSGTTMTMTSDATGGSGTFAAWTISAAGNVGASGAAATISVGTVTTGAAGSSATVSNTGTSSAAVLAFSIPTGATGATGPGAPLTSSATAPVSPSSGQVWFNTTTGASFIYYNSAWVELGGGTMSPYQSTSTARPAGPWTGMTTYDTDTKIGYQYDGTNWGPTYPGSGFRNVIINGDMRIAQRGTSTASITTGNYYTCDRWNTGIVSAGTWTQTQSTDAPAGFGNSLKMQCTTASASPILAYIQTKLEGQNLQIFAKGTASAKSFSLSFWVKAFQTGTYICELYDGDNTRQCSKSYTVNTSGTWEYKTITFPSDTTGVFDNDNGASMVVNFWLAAGSILSSGTLNTSWGAVVSANQAVGQTNVASSTSNYFQITGVQLEANPQPTPFEQRPIGAELALCQRYYINLVSGTGKALGTAYMSGTTTWEAAINFPTYMRTAPTLAYVTGTQYYGVYMLAVEQRVDSMTLDFATPSACRVYGAIVGATSTNGVAGILYTRNASAFLSVQAEL